MAPWRDRIGRAVELGLLALVLARLYWLFHPYGAVANPFNSDTAVTVIMARDGYWSPFALYYYAQDRIGAWPGLLVGWIGRAAGVAIDAPLYYAVTFAGLIGSLGLALRAARVPVAAGLAAFCLLEFAGDATLRPYIFDICQPWPWATICVVLFVAIHLRLLHLREEGARPAEFALGFLACALGIWEARSVVVLLALVPPLFGFLEWRSGAATPRRQRYLLQGLAVLLAILAERQLRAMQLAYARAAGLYVFSAPVALNFGLVHEPTNRPYVFDAFQPGPWALGCFVVFVLLHVWLLRRREDGAGWGAFALGAAVCTLGIREAHRSMVPLLCVPPVFGLLEWRRGAAAPRRQRYLLQWLAVLVAILADRRLRLRQLLQAGATAAYVSGEPPRLDLGGVCENFRMLWPKFACPAAVGLVLSCVVVMWVRRRTTPAALPLSLLFLGALNFPIWVGSDWARANLYSPRYFSISYALFTAALAAALAPHLRRRPVVVGVLLIGALLPLPLEPSATTSELLRRARVLEQRFPGAPLVGSHWRTYVYVGLQNERPLVPVVFDSEHQRTPWTRASLLRAERALVSWDLPPTFNTTLSMEGCELTLERREAIPGADVPVALYRVKRVEQLLPRRPGTELPLLGTPPGP